MWWPQNLLFWLIALVVGGVVALVVAFIPFCLLAARFERRYIRLLVPLDDEQGPASRNTTAAEIADTAVPLGFLYVGAFRDEESKIVKGRHDIYLTPDGEVMLLIPSLIKMMGYRLITRTADDVWLFTGEVAGDADLSGLRRTRCLPGCTLPQVLRYHRDRVESHPAVVVPFDPETLICDMRDHDQLRAQRAVEAGLARWVSDSQDCYTSTWRGAFKLTRAIFNGMASVKESQKLAERYKSHTEGAA